MVRRILVLALAALGAAVAAVVLLAAGRAGAVLPTDSVRITPATHTVQAGKAQVVTLTVLTPGGTPDTAFSGTFRLSSSDPSASLPSSVTIAPGSGTATFNLTLRRAGHESVAATDGPAHLSRSVGFAVVPGPAVRIVPWSSGGGYTFVGQPAFQQVVALDAFDNPTPDLGGYATVSTSDHRASYPKTTPIHDGSISFSVTFRTAGSQTVTVTDAKNPAFHVTYGVQVTQGVLPGPPTGLSVVPGDSMAQVTFGAPTQPGNPPLTEYTVTTDPPTSTSTFYGSGTVDIYNLTDGTTYTFSVVAVNVIGSSAPVTSSPVPIGADPYQPDVFGSTPGDGQVTVSFYDPDDPGDNGGYAVTSLTATASPVGASTGSVSTTVSPDDAYTAFGDPGGPYGSITLTGLTDGTSYQVSVTATSSFGTSNPGGLTSPVVPVGLPGAPTIGIVTPGDASASVPFTPGPTNGSTVTYYLVSWTDTTSGATGTQYVTASPAEVQGLANGDTYTFSVQALNSAFVPGAASATSSPVVVARAPDAPFLYNVAPQGTGVALDFEGSGVYYGSDGGLPVTGYTATVEPGDITATGTSSPIDVTGLTPGTEYSVSVTATNAAGTSPASNTQDFTAPAIPDPPVIDHVGSGVGSLSVSWQGGANADDTDPLQGVTVTVTPETPLFDPTAVTVSSGLSSYNPVVLTGLAPGQPYDITISATNDVGTSATSAPDGPFTPAGLAPQPPTDGTAVSGDGQLTLPFTPPTDTGSGPVTGYTVTATPYGTLVAPSADPVTAGCTVADGSCDGDQITVTGLTDLQEYLLQVTATNYFGTSNPTGGQVAVPLPTAGAPTGVTATGDQNGESTVSFTPGDAEGYPIEGYAVYDQNENQVGTGTASPIVVQRLTNGQSYSFTVVEYTEYAVSPPSAPSNTITPWGPPAAPTSVTATPSDGQASVSFNASDTGGGPAVTGYTVTSSPGGLTGTGTSSPVVVTGLTDGQSYTFSVTATSASGTSNPGTSNAVTPTGLPGTPTSPSATAGDDSASVSFSPPATDGGLAIDSYTVTASPGGLQGSGAGSPVTVSGLTPGGTYTFTVTAHNANGTGAATGPTTPVTLNNVPDPPTLVSATGGNQQALVSFTPSSDGGEAVTSYTVTSSPGGLTASGASSPITVTGLTNGQAYTFTVTATNGQGTSAPSSPSSPAAPATVPAAPGGVSATAGDTTALVSFSTPADGGSAITGYTVSASSGGITATGSSSPIEVTGLTDGTSYTFTVTATNGVGTSPASSPSAAVTPDPVDLITNNCFGSGFTQNLSPWSVSGFSYGFNPGMGTAGCSGSLRLSSFQAYGSEATLNVAVPSTGTTTLSFWYQSDDTTSTGSYYGDTYSAQIQDIRTGQIGNPLDVTTPEGSWTHVTYTVPQSMEGDTVTVSFSADGEYDSEDMWVTDVTMIN